MTLGGWLVILFFVLTFAVSHWFLLGALAIIALNLIAAA